MDVAGANKEACGYRSVNGGAWSRWGLCLSFCVLVMLRVSPPVCAENKGPGLRYRFKRECGDIAKCKTECEDAEARSRELDMCLVDGSTPTVKGANRCSMERAAEMRAFYVIVGCVMYFYPGHEILPLEGE